MSQFVEDPAIAAAIADLKSRWPAIGEAADHPLTEWFIKRLNGIPPFNKRKSIWRRPVILRAGSPPKQKDILDPYMLIATPGDLEQWQNLLATPLEYRDIAGICMATAYYNLHRSKWFKWLDLIVFLVSLPLSAVIGFIIYFFWKEIPNPKLPDWNLVQWLIPLLSLIYSNFEFAKIIHKCIINFQPIKMLSVNQYISDPLYIPLRAFLSGFALAGLGVSIVYAVQTGRLYVIVAATILIFILARYLNFTVNRIQLDEWFLKLLSSEPPKRASLVNKILDTAD